MNSTLTPDNTSNHGISGSAAAEGGGLESMASYAAPVPPVDPHHLNHASKAKLARFYRAQRWAQRDTMRRLLPGTSCAKCGRPVSKATGIGLYWDENHGARFAGLRTCGSVWCCPVCNAKIQAYRQRELQSALDAAKSRGWGLVFGTLTLRHQLGDPLDKVRDMCQKVWRSVQQQKGTRRLLDSLGLQGYIRAMEVTFSNENGWHVHLHVFWLFSHPLTPDQLDNFRTDYADRWISAVDRVNARAAKQDPSFKPFAAPLPANQLFKSVRLTSTTLRTYSRYVTTRKTVAPSGRSAVWRASQELTNTQSKIGKVKSHNGKSVLHLNFWDFLSILHDLGYGTSAYKTRLSAANACYVRLRRFGYSPAQLVACAKAYYQAMKGARALTWSRNLRQELGISVELDDATIAAQEFEDPKSHVLDVWDWSQCLSRRDSLAAQLLDICDTSSGNPAVCLRFCRLHEIHTKPPHLRRRFGTQDDSDCYL